MSCTRLYVEPTETRMGQGRKRRLLSLLKEWLEKTRGYNSSNIIANTKEIKLALIGPFVWTLGILLSPLKRVFIIELSPPPGLHLPYSYSYIHKCTINDIRLNIRDISKPLLRVSIIQVTSTPVSRRLSDCTYVSSSARAMKIYPML